jgi:hypothetical protein
MRAAAASASVTTTPPTLVSTANTGTLVTTTPQTLAGITVQTGDIVVLAGYTSDTPNTLATPTGGGLTWTLRQFATYSSRAPVYIWTATATSSQTFTASVARTAGTYPWGFVVSVWRGSDGVGASAQDVGSGTPSLGITTTYANSALAVVSTDWNANNGASRVWLQVNGASPVEQAYFYNATYMTAYAAYYADAGSVGAKTVGLSAPAAQQYEIVAVEVRGHTA